MAKRCNNNFARMQTSKKPKLDICVTNRTLNASKQNKLPQTSKSADNDALWAEDDDEIIFLASQAVEAAKITGTNRVLQESMQDITFSRFAREVKTSTQLTRVATDIFSKLLNEGEDDFKNLDDSAHCRGDLHLGNDVKRHKSAPTNANAHPSKEAVKDRTGVTNKIDTKDAQVSFLMARLDSLTKQNQELTNTITDFDEKMQTKEGEVSVLRSEIQRTKQMNDSLRLEKIQANKIAEKTWQDKIEELERQLKAQQWELDIKKMEKIKRKNLNETQNIQDTYSALHKNLSLPMSVHHLNLCNKREREQTLPAEIFAKFSEPSFSFRESVFRKELEALQSVLARASSFSILDQVKEGMLTDEVLEICSKNVVELRNYISRLRYNQYRDTNAHIEYQYLLEEKFQPPVCRIHQQGMKNVFQETPLFPDEKAVSPRRIVAIVSLICNYLSEVKSGFLNRKVEGQSLLAVITNAINILGFSRELSSHAGLIESLGKFLNSFNPGLENGENHLANYVKYLIFSRPAIRSIVEISSFLHKVSLRGQSSAIMKSLCTLSTEHGCFFIHEHYKIFQFTQESCPLQVYGALLEVVLPQYKSLSTQDITSLAAVCLNHARFLRNSFEKVAHWILTPGSEPRCDCYAKASTSFVILFHLALHQWISDPKSIEIRKIAKIVRIGLLVLCDIFHTNYQRHVIRSGGSAVKHRLNIIYDWTISRQMLFKLKSPHLNALNHIKLLHDLTDPIKNQAEQSSEDHKADGNYIWNKVVDEFI